MVEGYWNRQQASLLPSGPMLKRPRSDYSSNSIEMKVSYEGGEMGTLYYVMFGIFPSLGCLHVMRGMVIYHEMMIVVSIGDRSVKDTRTIGSAYGRYLQSAQYLSFPSGEASALGGARSGMGVSGGMAGIPIADGVSGRPGIIGRDMVSNGPSRDLDDRLPVETMARPDRETLPLPPDASNTLYVEGLPPDTTRREVAHILFDTLALRNDNIFRPFVGYKEVRLVSKESKQPWFINNAAWWRPSYLCFVDFASPACAATAMSALARVSDFTVGFMCTGYKMDKDDSGSRYLQLQFSRFPGPRSSSGTRGRR
ncbi:hypothetical protein Patl1_08099 [Pistacia atlantica]|uniref:Uncharacterized protein n=1 Tax=Pistacia atlantica TaxID=434234 RepID=A0ACC1AJ11_9ROSI|nr:hypothetical protein Patl1_08099 [Pistacia atlantica]